MEWINFENYKVSCHYPSSFNLKLAPLVSFTKPILIAVMNIVEAAITIER